MTLKAQAWAKIVRNGGEEFMDHRDSEDSVRVKNPEMFQPVTQDQW